MNVTVTTRSSTFWLNIATGIGGIDPLAEGAIKP
jgi:hypothetical protein